MVRNPITAVGVLLITATAVAVTSATAATDGRWRILLGQQLKAEKDCDLKEVITMNEMQLGGEVALDGRISCIDGREFNFTRKRPHEKFHIELCDPLVC